MGHVARRRAARRRWANRWRLALLAVVVIGGAFAVGGGAHADRQAAVRPPTLESLLERREALERPPAPAPAPERLRERYEELRRRRAEIEGDLPPALPTPRSRRPDLRAPARDVPGRRAVKAVDGGDTNPDRIAFQVAP